MKEKIVEKLIKKSHMKLASEDAYDHATVLGLVLEKVVRDFLETLTEEQLLKLYERNWSVSKESLAEIKCENEKPDED
ncbi:MAG: hypothetical protein ACO2ZP_00515 [Bacteriovoracaceae bacterium]